MEDDDSEALVRWLDAARLESASYASAEALLEAAAREGAACVASDLKLPAMSGLELLAELRARGGWPPFILVTAHDAPGLREEAARRGAAAYLVKPFLGRTLGCRPIGDRAHEDVMKLRPGSGASRRRHGLLPSGRPSELLEETGERPRARPFAAGRLSRPHARRSIPALETRMSDILSQSGGSSSEGPRAPLQLSTLLQDLARAPGDDLLRAWEQRLRPGDTVDRFEILREIGRGGFGVVYEALDRELGRSVAFKTLRTARTGHELSADWILKEAEAVARLEHPAIVTLHEVGRCASGPYLVEELLHGETLAERLRRGALSARECVAVGLEIARGLAHAHGRGVVHRDLKPGNVFLTEDGRAKLLDFGLAHLLGTRGLHGAGTPAYMAPEQLRGETADARADVYSLGATLYEALAGRPPFEVTEGRSAALDGRPAPALPRSAPAPLVRLVERCLSTDPARRPASGQAVAEELLAVQRVLDRPEETGRAEPGGILSTWVRELRRRRVFRALVVYAAAAFVVLQVIQPVMRGLHLPEWVLTAAVVALGLGFPVTVGLAWVYDLTRRGVERTEADAWAEKGRGPRGARLALLLLGLGAAAAAPGLVYFFVWPAAALRGAEASAPSAASGRPLAQAQPRKVAVLPLVNLSGDPRQEYFNDGMTEEITSRLSRLAGLAVTARTSVARYKGSTRTAREIGAELDVAFLVEGSVRRAGDRIRVTASLVRTDDAVRLWSEDLDARLDDVFAVQERIASRIVDALGLKLTPGEERTLRSWGTRNAAAYDEYLRGQARFDKGPDSRAALDEATAHFRKALALDEGFAPALAGLAACEAMLYRDWDSRAEQLAKAEALAGRALALDPQLPPALKAAADIRGFRFDYAGAAEQYRRLVDLTPRDHVAWDQLCWALGYATPPTLDEAETSCHRALALQPSYPAAHYHLLRVHVLMGRLDDAEADLAALGRLPHGNLLAPGRYWVAMGRGRPAEALASIRGRSTNTNIESAWRAMALAQLGRKEEAFAALEASLAGGYRDIGDLRTSRWYEPLRRDERWAATLGRHGLAP